MIGTVRAQVGRPVIVKGMAGDYDKRIVRMEFSLDGGETWTPYETDDDVVAERNLAWQISYTPPVAGRYRMLVRSVNEDGIASPEPADVYLEVS